jgi:microcystin-dependent protein
MSKILGKHSSGTVGSIITNTSSIVPIGTLSCDGSPVSRTTYAALFAIIGITAGQGDGSTTFNLPDYRGRFLRGRANSSANDPDRASRTAMNTGGNTGDTVNSVQTVATKMPNTPFAAANTELGRNFSAGTGDAFGSGSFAIKSGGDSTNRLPHTHAISGGDSETRPINAYVEFVICFK